jgi:hypothetical protein
MLSVDFFGVALELPSTIIVSLITAPRARTGNHHPAGKARRMAASTSDPPRILVNLS